MTNIAHIPVLVKELILLLKPVSNGVYIDTTLGGGGHSQELLKYLGSEGVVIGMDRDKGALSLVERSLADVRLKYLHGRFSEMAEKVRALGYEEVDGIIMDFGVSMMQIKEAERGFSFYSHAPLDMRMNMDQSLTASEVVNTWREKDLLRILREYGEENKAIQIAKAIIEERKVKEIGNCVHLAGIVERVYKRRGRRHPATKTFQALRIAVNDELNELSTGLVQSLNILKRRGRLCVITYHSLEDRISKRFFIAGEKEGQLKRLNKKVIIPSERELKKNPSSRSAKLRGVERL